MSAGNVTLLVTPWRSRLPVTVFCAPEASMLVTVNVLVGNFAASKKSGLLRCPVTRSLSAQVEAMAILISEAAILPSATLTFPANFLNPPLWWPVTFEPTKPIVDSARTTYSLAVGDGWAVGFASVAVVLTTLSAGSEQPVSQQAAGSANSMASRGREKSAEMWFDVFINWSAVQVRDQSPVDNRKFACAVA